MRPLKPPPQLVSVSCRRGPYGWISVRRYLDGTVTRTEPAEPQPREPERTDRKRASR